MSIYLVTLMNEESIYIYIYIYIYTAVSEAFRKVLDAVVKPKVFARQVK